MKLGILINLNEDIENEFSKTKNLGIPTCQLNCWDESLFTDQMAERIIAASVKYGVEISHFWCGWTGPRVWNLIDGPSTLGLVPPSFRYHRLQMLLKGADFTKKLGVPHMITHVGFIPENPAEPEYRGLISTLQFLVKRCKDNGINFLFETGQETPVTLLRTIEDIGADNVGVNLDPANLILYGKGNPVDALDVIGKYVKGVHGKDGLYPTNGRLLGEEMPLGAGKVNFPALISRLKEVGYEGPITIEREISGEQQVQDIILARKLLEKLI